MYKGVAVSPGVAVGVAYRIESTLGPSEPQFLTGPDRVPAEIARFDQAVTAAAAEVERYIQKVAPQLGASEAAIFQGHLQLINDEELRGRVRSLIETRSFDANTALSHVFQEFAGKFVGRDQDFFRERLADFRDIVQRIVSHLARVDDSGHQVNGVLHSERAEGNGDEPIIIVTHELLPSQALSFGETPIAGIVTETGGGTSHAAILSRSRGIPAVSGVAGIFGSIANGDPIIVDGRDGVVVVRPDPETTAAYRKMQREFFDLKDRLVSNKELPSITSDGARIELLTNINNVADAQASQMVGADGVGLYRTEFLFLSHQDVPDEEEQYEYYKKIIELAPHSLVTIRTLDLGGDKTVPYLGRKYEANPFMGWRSIRLSFEHPRLFEQQIRAILRAGRHGRVNMLFPMITTLEELRHVNRLVDEARRSLRKEGVPYGENVRTGVMVEVPAAAVCIDAILRETDFISIGTNDLIQYLHAADRDNPKVAHLCEPLSPAVFRVLQMILEACKRTGTHVTVCGEMAGLPRSVLTLLGMGLRNFSMSPAFVPTIKALFSKVTTAQAERFAHHVLQLKTSEEIRAYLTARLHEVASDLELFDFV